MGLESEPHEDEWDFYFCVVDDRPASIFLNLRYELDAERRRGDTLGWARIGMLDSDEHGMGSAAEAEVLWPLEESLVQAASERGLVQVGRLRTDATWELTFYGSGEIEHVLRELAEPLDLGGRPVEVGSRADGDWAYYDEFLVPDAERRQWMHDRRIVDVLHEHGDDLSPRPVNHWAYFPSAAARDAFVADTGRLGFALEAASEDASGPMPFGANVVRDDSVEVDEIHDVVMSLIELARRHGGDYDGWETAVLAPKRRGWGLRRRGSG